MQDGRLELNQPGRRGRLRKQVGSFAQEHAQAHDRRFPQGVDRGIGHFRKTLLEVVEQGTGQVAQGGDGRVIAHGPHRFGGIGQIGTQHHHKFLGGEAERNLPFEQGQPGRGVDRPLRTRLRFAGAPQRAGQARFLNPATLEQNALQRHQVVLEPLAVRPPVGHLRRDLGVGLDRAGLGVHTEDLAGTQSALGPHRRLVVANRAHLAGTDDNAVLQQHVPCRPQAVAVHDRAHDPAVGIGNAGRAVPRLEQGTVVLVEGPALRGHIAFRNPFPGFRHHHQQGMPNVAPAAHQQFQLLVELAAVAGVGVHDRQQIVQALRPYGRRQVRLAGAHPQFVALERVDFAVVANQVEGLRLFPGRERVRAVALVEHGQGRFEQRVVEVRVEPTQHVGQDQPLVHDGATAQARHVEAFHTPGLRLFQH